MLTRFRYEGESDQSLERERQKSEDWMELQLPFRTEKENSKSELRDFLLRPLNKP